MKTLPLDFITLRDANTGRASSLSTYGRQNKGALKVVGNLEHGAKVIPASISDANKLITWLNDWKDSQPK